MFDKRSELRREFKAQQDKPDGVETYSQWLEDRVLYLQKLVELNERSARYHHDLWAETVNDSSQNNGVHDD